MPWVAAERSFLPFSFHFCGQEERRGRKARGEVGLLHPLAFGKKGGANDGERAIAAAASGSDGDGDGSEGSATARTTSVPGTARSLYLRALFLSFFFFFCFLSVSYSFFFCLLQLGSGMPKGILGFFWGLWQTLEEVILDWFFFFFF